MDPFLFNMNMNETSLQNLMKEIGEAVKLDDESHDKGAYIKYTSCIFKIASNLLLGIKGSQLDLQVTPSVSRHVKLLQHCVERVNSLVEKMEKEESDRLLQPVSRTNFSTQHGLDRPNITDSRVQPDSAPFTSTPSPTHLSTQRSPLDDTIHMTVPALPPENNPHMFNKAREVSPLERAHAQNRSLIIAYKARMERLNKSNFSAYSYSLTLQRKMTENLEIAKAQEEELAKKMKARQERLEEAAARRFAHPTGMSDEERELRQIYKNILTYENDVEWLSGWRHKLAVGREDPIVICQLVQEILRCSDHPFTEMLRAFQFKVYQQLYPLVVNRHPEVDLVKVDLPNDLWPSAEEVADILSAFARRTSNPAPEVRRRRRIRSRGRNSSENNSESISHDTDGDELGSIRKLVKDPVDASVAVEDSDSSQAICDKTVDEEASSDRSKDLSENRQEKLIPENNSEKHHDTIVDVISASNNISAAAEKDGEISNSSVTEDNELVSGDNNKVEYEDVTDLSMGDEGTIVAEESDIVSAVSDTKEQLRHAYTKGRQLESQLSVQHQQARMLMIQISQGKNFDEEDFDDLFDDEDDDDIQEENSDDDSETPNGHEREESREVSGKVTSGESAEPGENITDGSKVLRSNSACQIPRFSSFEGQPEEMYTSLPPLANLQDHKTELSEKNEEQQLVSKMKLEAYERHLKTICKEIHCELEKLLRVMIVAYEVLDSPVGKDQCAVALEEPFFKPIWKTLLRLFRIVNHRKEILLACVMTTLKDASPETMKIRPKFQLSTPSSQVKPYQAAIEELQRLPHYYTIPCKMDCLVKVCRLICECVDKFYTSHQSVGDESQSGKKADPPALGADDLVPLLTYVIVHSQCPQLISECQAMAEFIAEGYMMGEEGYCLTTFRTAVEYLISIYEPLETKSTGV